jgi:arginine N-succinyltransferase
MSAIQHSYPPLNTPQHVLMVRPIAFRPNEQTAHDNTFQHTLPLSQTEQDALAKQALAEFDAMVEVLNANDITVSVFDAIDKNTPDAVFPNNWLSTHPCGMLVTYPMFCENRRAERRNDIVNYLKGHFQVTQHVDLSECEKEGLYAEGTGAMVIDHAHKLAYVCLSQRANQQAIEKACSAIKVTPIFFNAFNKEGVPVYHTNVMMCVGSDFAIVARDMISPEDKPRVLSTLEETGKNLVFIDETQVNAFAGNCLELVNYRNERFLVLSATAYASLCDHQRAALPADLTLLPISVSTIEMAGGSVRCMMAGIHLPITKR